VKVNQRIPVPGGAALLSAADHETSFFFSELDVFSDSWLRVAVAAWEFDWRLLEVVRLPFWCPRPLAYEPASCYAAPVLGNRIVLIPLVRAFFPSLQHGRFVNIFSSSFFFKGTRVLSHSRLLFPDDYTHQVIVLAALFCSSSSTGGWTLPLAPWMSLRVRRFGCGYRFVRS